MEKKHGLSIIAAATGILVWAGLSAITSQAEAWDSPLYFSLGIPLLCVLAGILGGIEPKHAVRWGVIPVAAQAAWMFFTQGFGNLAPLGMMLFGVLMIPLIVAAQIGAFFGRRKVRHLSP
jgi:hypothetical protein